MHVTNAPDKFIANALEFGGSRVEFENELKNVGVMYDHKLNWSKMAAEMASRGRKALGFLYRLGDLISPRDLETIYKYFVRSSMEFGNASYIGAAPTNLDPLDATQRRAEKPSGIKMHSLSARRDAVCVGLLCKILDGECVKPVADAFSNLQLVNDPEARGRDASKVHITNMKHTLRKTSLNTFKRCFIARAHDIFDSIPEHLIERGFKHGWTYSSENAGSAMKEGQKFLASRLSGERVFKAKNNLVDKQAVKINSQQNRSKNENVSQELSYAYRKYKKYAD
jgi:hypothetical protein